MIEKEGLILSLSEYKDRDALVYFLSKEGLQTIYARGIQSVASKNKRLCNPFSYVRLTLDHKETRKMDYLIRGDLLAYYYKIQEDLFAQSLCFVLRDCIIRSAFTPLVYSYLFACWNSFQKEDGKAISYACLILATLLKKEGIAPFVEGCVRCGSRKGIETVSLREGGFLCKDCNQKEKAWKKDELRKFRSLFIVKREVVETFMEVYTYSISDFLYLAFWFEQYAHVQLSSLQFLKSIEKMYV